MKSRHTLVGQVLLIILAFSLAACERSASSAPPTAAVFPEAATPSMDMVEQMLTPQVVPGEDIPGAQETAAADPFSTLAALEGQAPPTQEISPIVDPPTPIIPEPQPTIETIRPTAYTLQKGEFPYCIARRYNLNPAELLALNNLGLAQSNILQPGLVLQIPAGAGPFITDRALQAHPAQYTVQQNDTIYSIACKYGDVDPVNIAAVNNLAAPYTLTVGTILQIP
ncbi:MAG: LysM peptidoglycan-binding domain-containing protein [Anaerolineales bacterium]|nr:LysM peptidoglycan-binding domain-containing protein [Anaerolineales bacterium]